MENFIKSITTGANTQSKNSTIKQVLLKALFYLGVTTGTAAVMVAMWFCYIVFASMV